MIHACLDKVSIKINLIPAKNINFATKFDLFEFFKQQKNWKNRIHKNFPADLLFELHCGLMEEYIGVHTTAQMKTKYNINIVREMYFFHKFKQEIVEDRSSIVFWLYLYSRVYSSSSVSVYVECFVSLCVLIYLNEILPTFFKATY